MIFENVNKNTIKNGILIFKYDYNLFYKVFIDEIHNLRTYYRFNLDTVDNLGYYEI